MSEPCNQTCPFRCEPGCRYTPRCQACMGVMPAGEGPVCEMCSDPDAVLPIEMETR